MGAAAKVGFPGRGTWLKRMVERGTGPPAEVCALTGAATGCLKTACAYCSDAPSPACNSNGQCMLEAQRSTSAKSAAPRVFGECSGGLMMLHGMGYHLSCLESRKSAVHSAKQEDVPAGSAPRVSIPLVSKPTVSSDNRRLS